MSTPPPSRPAVFRVVPVVLLLAAMWVAESVDAVLPADLDVYGIEVRNPSGVSGVIAAPFLHLGFGHLMANTLPFLVLGSLVALRNPRRFWAITVTIVVVGGLAVWLLGPSNSIVIGASGLVFGYLAYLITAGIFTRQWFDVAIAGSVLFMYGGLIAGAVPFGVSQGISWQAHLAGAAAGVLAAYWFARGKRPSPDQPA